MSTPLLPVLTVTAVLAFGVHAGAARRGPGQLDEHEAKSAAVYAFLQYVDWPSARLAPTDTITICVFGDDAITTDLIARTRQRIKGHPLRVRGGATSADLAGCHAVFVPAADAVRLPELRDRYRGTGLLTVTEDQTGKPVDAVINVVIDANRIAFDVNLAESTAQGLAVSSRLIQLARHVSGTPVQPGRND
jgi:hypothetical protein